MLSKISFQSYNLNLNNDKTGNFKNGRTEYAKSSEPDDGKATNVLGLLKSVISFQEKFSYADAESFSGGLAKVKLNDKFGLINKSGKEITPIKYDLINYFYGARQAHLNGKMDLIDENGKEVSSFKYDWIFPFSEGLARVKLNKKSGFVDKSGKEIIPLKYEDIGVQVDSSDYGFSEGLVIVKLNGKYGFIDKNGKEVTAIKYDSAFGFSKGLASVKSDGNWFYIGHNGTEYYEP